MIDEWIQRGRQKRLLVHSLERPLTFREIRDEILRIDPDSPVQLRDIWLLTKKMEMCGLMRCVSDSKEATGKVYALTEKGKNIVLQVYGRRVIPDPEGIDWNEYGWIARAKARREVLIEFERKDRESPDTAWRACDIRKSINVRYPMGYRDVLGIINELLAHRMIENSETKGRSKLYRITKDGQKIARIMQRTPELNPDSP